jgi:hypothetical protein
VESKSQAEDWKRHLTKTSLRTSGRGARVDSLSGRLSASGDAEEVFEVPDLGASGLDWGDPNHVSEVEITPTAGAKQSPVFVKKASASATALPRTTGRLMMGKK